MQTLILDNYTPRSANEALSQNPRTRGRHKRGNADIVAFAANQQRLARAKVKRRVSYHVTWTRKGRLPDSHNFLKDLLDHLTACGALVDDADRWCAVGEMTISRGTRACVEITLEDLSPVEAEEALST